MNTPSCCFRCAVLTVAGAMLTLTPAARGDDLSASAPPPWAADRVIDAHAHLGTFEGYDLSVETLLSNVERYGVRLALVSNLDGANLEATANLDEEAANRHTLEVVREHPDRLRGMVWTRPLEGSAERVEPFLRERLPNGARAFVGLEFHPEMNGFSADDPRLDPYLELCERYFRPAVFHSGKPGSNSDSAKILAAARRHPKVPVVLYHMGFGEAHGPVIAALKSALAKGDANVYLGTAQADPEAVLTAVRELGAGRVLFGTDATYYGKEHYERYRELVDRLRKELGPTDFARVMGGNAASLFDLQELFDGPAPAPASAQVATSKRYAFYSQFWINLHHFLYQEAIAKGGENKEPAPQEGNALTIAERARWEEAVAFYRQQVISKDLISNFEMRMLKGRLITLENITPTSFADLELPMFEALEKAAPIYRKRWWPVHDQANRRWVEALLPRLNALEDTFAERLQQAYGSRWPEEVVRVDLSPYGSWAGAYTSSFPNTHSVISSLDPGYRGDFGFEMTFHETSHSGSLIRPVQQALAAAFGKHGERAPRDLWHVVLFWTSGEIARQILAEQGVEDYMPYAVKQNLYEGPWGVHREALEGTWTSYMAGEMEQGVAYERLAEKWLKLRGE